MLIDRMGSVWGERGEERIEKEEGGAKDKCEREKLEWRDGDGKNWKEWR
jgi:hypothetical protein